MTFDGYYKVYGKYEKASTELLPALEEGEVFENVPVISRQHFTEPPARYTEARLIKELEEKFGVTIQEGNGLDAMLKDTLERRPEVV